MDNDRNKEMRSLNRVTDRDVHKIYEDDPKENVKGGFFDIFKNDLHSFYSFTGINLEEFDTIHDVVKDCLEHHGRERNPKNGSKDLLLLLQY